MKTVVSPCMDTFFCEYDDFSRRINSISKTDCVAVEMWFARDKDSSGVREALTESELSLRLMLADPVLDLTDKSNRKPYIEAMARNVYDASTFDTDSLIVQSGQERPDLSRVDQARNVRDTLAEAADVAGMSGISLLYEPLNTRIDHKGYFANDTSEAIALVRDVDSPSLRMLVDLYHASVMGEDIISILKGNLDIVSHFHIADTNGRHEPGTGDIDYPRIFRWLHEEGYKGSFGLEFYPTKNSGETIAHSLFLLEEAGFTV